MFQTSSVLYRHCMEEVKYRLLHADKIIETRDRLSSYPTKYLQLENVALQHRKVIELIAMASIAANIREYSKLRANFARDWNARFIFKDVERLNPAFYPIPISGTIASKIEGDAEIIDEYEDGYLTRDNAIEHYDRCSVLLHAENRLSSPRDLDADWRYFESTREPLRRLLNAFWVCLVPENSRYILQLNLNDVATPVEILGAEILPETTG